LMERDTNYMLMRKHCDMILLCKLCGEWNNAKCFRGNTCCKNWRRSK
jgi:hypothetical protein